MSDIHNASPDFILVVNDKLLYPAMFMLSPRTIRPKMDTDMAMVGLRRRQRPAEPLK